MEQARSGAPLPGAKKPGHNVTPFAKSHKRKTRAAWRALWAAVIVGGVVAHASLRWPCGPDAGGPLPSPATVSSPRETLRIATFNIHGCKGADGRRDVQRVAACLAKVDLAGLEEVHGRWPWEQADQAELLGRRLGQSWLFAPAVRQWYRDDFGNGLLSALPVSAWQRIPLPSDARDPRNALLATVDCPRGPIRVLIAHLTRRNPGRQEQQLRAVSNLFLSLKEPAILLGDLNVPADHPQIAQLLTEPGVIEPYRALRLHDDPTRIDWIFLRGLTPLGVERVDQGASDHPIVWVDVAVRSTQ